MPIVELHLGHKLDPATLDSIADIICGDDIQQLPVYRSSSKLTRFFRELGINAEHDGSTRKWWVLEILNQLQPSDLEKVILRLVDLREYKGSRDNLMKAGRAMNELLAMENLGIGFSGARPIIKRAETLELVEFEILSAAPAEEEGEFLRKQFVDDIKVSELGFDSIVTTYLQGRVDEAQSCPEGKVPLGTIFLLGSTLEGIILSVALRHKTKYITSNLAPKDRQERVKQVYDWRLSDLIDVAYEVGHIDLDVKKFSHVLRDFRNYIHPYHQMSQSFNPDENTVAICWQVFRAAITQLKASSA